MARTGYGSKGGYVMDNADRVATSGREALLIENVSVVPSSSLITLYNRNAAKYYGGATANTDLFTTGAAILSDIRQAFNVIPVIAKDTPYTTTTAIRPLTFEMVNGPTTVAIVHAPGVPSGATVKITVFGKSF
jgi:hypothetical protein